jgi:DNA-binding NarL/FixJ family response regulator
MESLKKLSIIIADDHPAVRYGIKSILEDISFIQTVSEATNGQQVLDLLTERAYDVILMDIRMPFQDGITTTSIISGKFPTVKVIALSMHADVKYIVEMLDKGASGYLLKSADREIIVSAILAVSRGEIYLCKEVSDILVKRLANDQKESNKKNLYHEEILQSIIFLQSHGKRTKEIADILCLSVRTIETYRLEIYKLTKADNLSGLIKYAIDQGISSNDLLIHKFRAHLGSQNELIN